MMRIFAIVSGMVKVFIFTIVSAGFIGVVAPVPAHADGQYKTETKAKPRKETVSPAQKKKLLWRLNFDLDGLRVDRRYALRESRQYKDEIAATQAKIEKEHKAQIKAGKNRRAIDKQRSKIVRELQRKSKTLTLVQKDKMVRQANTLSGDIGKLDKAVADSKHRVKRLRKSASSAATQKSRADAKILNLSRKEKKIEREIRALR